MKDYLRYLKLFDIHPSSMEQERTVQGQHYSSDINVKEIWPI